MSWGQLQAGPELLADGGRLPHQGQLQTGSRAPERASGLSWLPGWGLLQGLQGCWLAQPAAQPAREQVT